MKIGRYQVLGEIASGGMATVFLARLTGEAGFEKTVAIKKIHSTWSHDPSFAEMLIDEAKILVHLYHRNIVQIFELGREAGSYFIVMEYVAGMDLRRLQRVLAQHGKDFTLPIILRIAREVLAGLEFAHSRTDKNGGLLQIVHRDISPQNILISHEGDIKITDFGIAKVMGKSSQTATGMLKGKFAYMSPEQARGAELDARTDLFALGAVIYELATGRKCFEGTNDMDTLDRVRRAHVVSWQELPPALEPVLRRALAVNPDNRFADAAEMDDALAAVEKKLAVACDARMLRGFLRDLAQQEPPEQPTAASLPESDPEASTRLYLELLTDHGSGPRPTAEILPTRIEAVTEMEPRPDPAATRLYAPVRPPRMGVPLPQQPYLLKKIILPLGLVLMAFAVIIIWSWFSEGPPTVATAPLSSVVRFQNTPFESATGTSQLSAPITSPPPTALTVAKRLSPEPVLSAEKWRLKVKAIPETAKILILASGEKTSGTGETELVLLASSQAIPVQIVVSAPGYATEKKSINLDTQNPEPELKISLKKQSYGSVNVHATPWGQVSVGGQSRNGASVKFTQVPAGTQTITISHPPSKQRLSRTLTVPANGSVRCQASFIGTPSMTCTTAK